MFLSGLKCLSRLERQVKFAKNRCCKIKPVAVFPISLGYSQGRVKHDMRIAKKTRYKRVQNALISIAFLRFANALTNAPIKWLHKNAKIAFVRVLRFSQSELRFHFAFLRANAFAI